MMGINKKELIIKPEFSIDSEVYIVRGMYPIKGIITSYTVDITKNINKSNWLDKIFKKDNSIENYCYSFKYEVKFDFGYQTFQKYGEKYFFFYKNGEQVYFSIDEIKKQFLYNIDKYA